ncbi:hypothetical protein BDQ17DRAFT_1536722 [Cyathus striatus]|nr:hypothetical protein BDQ17DRAFT_1536722 [Cyathus striatus]
MSAESTETIPVWLITGTSSGLGLALVHAVLESGQRVVATLRDPSKHDALKQKFSEDQLSIVRLDVTSEEEINSVFDLAKSQFGRLDFVVNNAGYGILGEIEAVSEEEARKLFEVQFWGPMRISKQAVTFFRDHNPQGKGGRIVNITSMGGYTGEPGLAFYSASKYALEGLTEALDREMSKDWNIRAIIIEPGSFDSEWVRGSMLRVPQPPQYADPENSSSRIRRILTPGAGIALGDVNKIANAILKIAVEPNPPGRLQLGSDSWKLVKEQNMLTNREADIWKELSCSTDKDGVMDGIQRGEAMAAGLGIIHK